MTRKVRVEFQTAEDIYDVLRHLFDGDPHIEAAITMNERARHEDQDMIRLRMALLNLNAISTLLKLAPMEATEPISVALLAGDQISHTDLTDAVETYGAKAVGLINQGYDLAGSDQFDYSTLKDKSYDYKLMQAAMGITVLETVAQTAVHDHPSPERIDLVRHWTRKMTALDLDHTRILERFEDLRRAPQIKAALYTEADIPNTLETVRDLFGDTAHFTTMAQALRDDAPYHQMIKSADEAEREPIAVLEAYARLDRYLETAAHPDPETATMVMLDLSMLGINGLTEMRRGFSELYERLIQPMSQFLLSWDQIKQATENDNIQFFNLSKGRVETEDGDFDIMLDLTRAFREQAELLPQPVQNAIVERAAQYFENCPLYRSQHSEKERQYTLLWKRTAEAMTAAAPGHHTRFQAAVQTIGYPKV